MTIDKSTSGRGEENGDGRPMERRNYAPAREEPLSLKLAPRCQAQRMSGGSCNSPAVKGKTVCRKHGGAKGSGGPKGEANGAYKHGGYTSEAIAMRQHASQLLRVVRAGDYDLNADDQLTLEMMRLLFGGKETREQRSARNKAAWGCRDRTKWGGQDRRGWPKHPGCKGYGWRIEA